MDSDKLDRSLVDAHARHDLPALVRLYTLAGNQAEMRQDLDAASFYLTHAYVFALELGAPEANALNKWLADHGRAHRLTF
ncbi:MAG: hypothetical protein AAGI09_10240 [Pseudomonadota bacterium]